MNRTSLTRRAFLRTAGVSAIGAAWTGLPRPLPAFQRPGKPRIAAIITEYRPLAHADVIVTRFLQGYILGPEEPLAPRTRVVSMYVDQFPPADLSRAMSAHYRIPIQPTIREALTLGGDRLAVDGVLIIGEHGNYPYNDKGQHLYPRRKFFEEVIRTFEETGQTAAVFNDKHLGFAWEDARWMYDQSRRLGFPLMAGSSLPTTWRMPDLELSLESDLEEGLAIGYGGMEAYGFHALETLQCMVERRRGGEAGVTAVTCLEGETVWQAGRDGAWSRPLLDAALRCVPNRPAEPPEQRCRKPWAYLVEHADSFRSAVLMLNGYTSAFGFAGKLKGRHEPVATQFWLQEPEYGHFAYLTHNIESMFLTGAETYPPDRTLLTTGILDAVMTSHAENHRRVETPWLADVAYRVGENLGRRARF